MLENERFAEKNKMLLNEFDGTLRTYKMILVDLKEWLKSRLALVIESFGVKIAIARPCNAYGTRDHFDLRKSHVIPAFILQ